MNKVFPLQLSGNGADLTEASYFSQQKFPWGAAVWLTEPDGKTMSRVTVGLITFYPFSIQPEHSHRREEQVIYVISGEGEHEVDGTRYPLATGNYFHVRPHARHVVINNSAKELRVLVMYIYSPLSSFDQASGELRPWYVDFIPGRPTGTGNNQTAAPSPAESAPPPSGGGSLKPYRPEPYAPDLSDEFFVMGAL